MHTFPETTAIILASVSAFFGIYLADLESTWLSSRFLGQIQYAPDASLGGSLRQRS